MCYSLETYYLSVVDFNGLETWHRFTMHHLVGWRMLKTRHHSHQCDKCEWQALKTHHPAQPTAPSDIDMMGGSRAGELHWLRWRHSFRLK